MLADDPAGHDTRPSRRCVHGPVAGQCVGEHDPLDSIRVAHGEGGRDGSAPVLADEGDVLEVQVLDQSQEVLGVGAQCVFPVLGRFGLTEAHVVWDHHAVVHRQRTDHVPVEVSPGRLSVEADDRFCATRPFIHEVLDETMTIEGMRGERERRVERLFEGDHGNLRPMDGLERAGQGGPPADSHVGR